MIFFYLVFFILNVVLGFVLYNVARDYLRTWNDPGGLSRPIKFGIGLVFTILSTLVWSFMVFYTIDAFLVAISNRPKPPILIIWMLCAFIFGATMSVASALGTKSR